MRFPSNMSFIILTLLFIYDHEHGFQADLPALDNLFDNGFKRFLVVLLLPVISQEEPISVVDTYVLQVSHFLP